ncbi:hypothetical protein AAEX28_15600 [Lentisphaerota bacterium WC36G]|nr:hypothetical protein LJT99_02360 [Lentisphaerae bacterium WC36]
MNTFLIFLCFGILVFFVNCNNQVTKLGIKAKKNPSIQEFEIFDNINKLQLTSSKCSKKLCITDKNITMNFLSLLEKTAAVIISLSVGYAAGLASCGLAAAAAWPFYTATVYNICMSGVVPVYATGMILLNAAIDECKQSCNELKE